ncbi:MAG: phage portal protein [Rhizobiaceae bacterium]|nr:phage portal protein [Rhizobiaceae bacterium]
MKNLFRWLQPAQSAMAAGRANATHAADSIPEHKSVSPSNLIAFSGAGHAQWSRPDYATMARRGYMANPIVFRCIRLISETAAAIPLLIYQANRELDRHPMLDLLSRPNPRQGGKEFVELLIGHLLVSGNAYVELVQVNDTPRELHALRPDHVTVVVDRKGWVEAYEHSVGFGKVRHAVGPDGQSAILHLSLFHPLDDNHGFPPLQAALMALDVHNAACQWNKSLLDNSARPSGALVYAPGNGNNMSEDQFARLKAELEDGYTGAAQAGRPLLLEGGLDWKAMGYSPRDMDFVEARHAAARDIALAFGVPPMLLGIPGDNTYSNYQEANRAFTRQTLLPLINRTIDSFNHWLQLRFDSGLRLAIDEDRIEGLASERQLVWTRLAAADFLSNDEKRQAVGYGPRSQGRGASDE